LLTLEDAVEADIANDGPLTFDNDPEEVEEDDAITTFLAVYNIAI